MADSACNVLLVVGSLHEKSVTRVVINHLAGNLSADGCEVNTLDFHEDPLPLFNPDTVWEQDFYPELKRKVVAADVIVLGTPDYHGSISSTLKNFLDHFWKEFTGKLFATVVASHEKGLTVHDQLRTVARQCYAWVMPYGVSFLGMKRRRASPRRSIDGRRCGVGRERSVPSHGRRRLLRRVCQ